MRPSDVVREARKEIPSTLSGLTKEMAGIERFIANHEHETDAWVTGMLTYYRTRLSLLKSEYNRLTKSQRTRK